MIKPTSRLRSLPSLPPLCVSREGNLGGLSSSLALSLQLYNHLLNSKPLSLYYYLQLKIVECTPAAFRRSFEILFFTFVKITKTKFYNRNLF